MTAKLRERDIKKYLLARVKALGGEARKVRWEGRSGAPDWRVMLCPLFIRPRCFWAELKAPGEKPTAAQFREHTRMRRHGETVYVFDSFESIDEVLPL